MAVRQRMKKIYVIGEDPKCLNRANSAPEPYSFFSKNSVSRICSFRFSCACFTTTLSSRRQGVISCWSLGNFESPPQPCLLELRVAVKHAQENRKLQIRDTEFLLKNEHGSGAEFARFRHFGSSPITYIFFILCRTATHRCQHYCLRCLSW